MSITARLQRRLVRQGFGRPLNERFIAAKISAREARNFVSRLRSGPANWEGFAGRYAVDGKVARLVSGAKVEPNAPLLIRIVRSPYPLVASPPRRLEARPVRERHRSVARAASVASAIAARGWHRPRVTRGPLERLALRPRPFRRGVE